MISWSEAKRPSCNVGLNVIRVVRIRVVRNSSPGEVHRHSLSAISVCRGTTAHCVEHHVSTPHSHPGSHVFGPEHDPDQTSRLVVELALMTQSRRNSKFSQSPGRTL